MSVPAPAGLTVAEVPGTTAVVAAGDAAAVAVAVGCGLLTLRPLLLDAAPDPTIALVALFVGLLALGRAWPVVRRDHRPPTVTVVGVLVLGVAAFALGRLLAGGRSPAPFALRLVTLNTAALNTVALNTLAAVAEEALFRRLAYAVLSPSGPAGAVAGTALLFAVVHVTLYGAWVLPIDVAAGLVLGWQRWATGSWWVPAATHVVANLLVVL